MIFPLLSKGGLVIEECLSNIDLLEFFYGVKTRSLLEFVIFENGSLFS
jgi:hypothetical protein